MHNVFVNCPPTGPIGNKIARCWGTTGSDPHNVPTPDQFAADYNLGGLSHVMDQYVGSTARNRYPLGLDVNVKYTYSGSTTANYQDVLNIVTSAATALGRNFAGYGDIYNLYFPAGVDVCTTSACVSGGTFCAFHASAEGTVQGYPVHLIFAALPYQNIPACKIAGGPNVVNDSMASVIGQEVSQMITDTDGDAWFNRTSTLLAAGSEIGEECQLAKFSRYPTVTVNGHPYKTQLEYSNAVRDCIDQP
jgi:hypothetical protein